MMSLPAMLLPATARPEAVPPASSQSLTCRLDATEPSAAHMHRTLADVLRGSPPEDPATTPPPVA